MNLSKFRSEREKSTMKLVGSWLAWICLVTFTATAVAVESDSHEDEAGGPIVLAVEDRAAAGVHVDTISRRRLAEFLRVPGEVRTNAYRSVKITPRITAQVMARHVRLGEHVEVGKPLVTLSSVEMAEAQGALIVTNLEWERVRILGRDAVSARRYIEAEVAAQQALARVLAYGMAAADAERLIKQQDPARATGDFVLIATIAGTVLSDDFIVGAFVDAGSVLFDISDESVVWIEAQAVANTLTAVPVGAVARVSLDGERWYQGTVIQRHHRMDERTRTNAIRIEVSNFDDRFHAGQFVQAEIATDETDPVLAVPTRAITRIEGVATVFKLEPGDAFHAENIEVGESIGDWTIVSAGLIEGDQIAVDGVFYLKSLKLKSSLGEGHGH